MKPIEVVRKINNTLFGSDYFEHDYFRYLEFVESPIGDAIKYNGYYLWDSENDYREWVDDDNQEDLEMFLIKELKKILNCTKCVIDTLENGYESE